MQSQFGKMIGRKTINLFDDENNEIGAIPSQLETL